MTPLTTVIEQARRQAFVGRRFELARFDELLAGTSSWRVMYVYGPGGIGKTALLAEFGARATAAGRTTVAVDLRDVECSPDGLRASYDWAATRAGGDPEVVLLDGYEHFAANDAWLRDQFLPGLVGDPIVVLSGQASPRDPWVTDAGWRQVVSVHPLAALDLADSRELVLKAATPAEHVDALTDLGCGHPLTLALLAEATKTAGAPPGDLADVPDLVATLATRVIGSVPSAAHATGLAVCAHAWLTTEDLLRRIVGDDAPSVWAWLESRPFVARAPHGLHPHALVRDALEADLIRRSPETYRRVHRAVHGHVASGLRRADGFDRQLLLDQNLWLHRHSPLSALYLMMRDHGPTTLVPGEETDHPAVLAIIEQSDTTAEVARAARWLAEKPENLRVVRVDGEVAAFAYNVLWPADAELCDADPVTKEILEFAAATSPARPGEEIWLGRFVGGRDGYQRDPLAVVAAATTATVDWVTRPLAWAFVSAVDAEFWGPAMDYIAFTRHLDIGEPVTSHVVYGNDWRRLSVESWQDVLGERELTGESGPAPAAMLRPPPLARSAFDDAVRAALRDLRRPDRLRGNLLMGSALAGGGDTANGGDAERLGAVLTAAIDGLAHEPRGERLVRVLDRTFRHAVPSQEAAAELLGLPFSTYRRHLGRAIERLTDVLWEIETGQRRGDEPATWN